MEPNDILANNSNDSVIHTHRPVYRMSINDLYNIGNYFETVRQDNISEISDIKLQLSKF
jgi:hypothetical protein